LTRTAGGGSPAREVECPLCGTTFECARDVGRWCSFVKPSRGAQEFARAGATDCVCPSCLAE
jgi:hypothetical protein